MGESVVISVSWVPVRREPDHRSEMVTQWLLGELLDLLEEKNGWLRCRGGDGYEGWTSRGGVLRLDPAAAGNWRERATAFSLGTSLVGESCRGGVRRLPFGARVSPLADGSVRLPGGRRARPADPRRLVPEAERSGRFPRSGEAVVASALRWCGVPYVWGGRTEWGTDCSGFVQSVYRLHGVELPRDSAQQRRAGSEVADIGLEAAPAQGPPAGEPSAAVGRTGEPRPGDLLFFAPEGRGVTHVAISLGGSRVVHAAASNGLVAVNDLEGAEELEVRLRASCVAVTRPVALPR